MTARHPPGRGRGMGGLALLVSAATMLSRVLGLAREMLFAALFGGSRYSDAFLVAFRIPNLLRDLFAEGALSAAFVPTFTDRLRNRGAQDAFRLANTVAGVTLVVVGGATIAGILAAPWIVDLLGWGFEPWQQELTTKAARIMFPFLLLVSLAAVVMGQLNAQERYGWPALASSTFNVVAIAVGAALYLTGVREEWAVLGWSAGTLLGGAAQLAVQLPALFSTGFRFRPRVDFRDAGVRRVARLMGPATVGLAATQINIVVNSAFASRAAEQISWLNYGFRLVQLPIGVFGVAVATIATTRLARAAADRDLDALGATLVRGLRLVAFLTVPSTVGLAVLREPIVRLIYERGAFDAADTAGTSAALLMYTLGLYCYSAVKVTAPAFYALGRARVPLVASVSAVAANLALAVVLYPVLQWRGLALATAAGATLNFLVLLAFFRRTAGPLRLGDLGAHLARVAAAAAACGLAAWVVERAAAGALGTGSLGARAAAVGGAVAAGALVYAAAARLLRIAELDELLGRWARRR